MKNSEKWAAKVEKQSKPYPSLVDQEGNVYPGGINLRAFCREHGLNFGNIYEMIKDPRRCVKGWKVTEFRDSHF